MGQTAPVVELYWDIGSTNTYFALALIEPVLARTGASLVLQPYNLGPIFRRNQYVVLEETPAKLANRKRDLARWAQKYQLPFRFPTVFPIKSSRVLRGALAMRQWGLEMPFVKAVFAAYWERDDASIADYCGLRPIVNALGIDPVEFERAAESEPIRQALIDSTDRGVARGIFGVPSFVVGDEIFWGKDRLDFVEDEIRRLMR